MNIFAPDYFNKFKCIATKCKHNCCIGWEIDIDDNSLDFYKTKPYILKHIDLSNTPHFKLRENDRCPFLNDDNLCEIIINHGENALCGICREHPRFYNCYDTRTEAGLGLTCEAAAELILNNPIKLIKIDCDNEEALENKFEEEFYTYREEIFATSYKNFANLLPDKGVNEIAEFFKTLERLDNSWEEKLSSLAKRNENIKDIKIENDSTAQNLFNYFVYRYFDSFPIDFCIFCTYFILCLSGNVIENSRAFSAEIEYSDQNVNAIQDFLDTL